MVSYLYRDVCPVFTVQVERVSEKGATEGVGHRNSSKVACQILGLVQVCG